MAITDKLHNIAEAMREADGSTRTYNLNQMAERPGVWQETIAEAITAKGVDTLPDASFDTMAVNIGLLGGGDCAALTKRMTFHSIVSSGSTFLVMWDELIEAGIIESAGQLISDLWENWKVEISASEDDFNHTGLAITRTKRSSVPLMVKNSAGNIKAYYGERQTYASSLTTDFIPKVTYSEYGITNSGEAGFPYEDANGIMIKLGSSARIGVGTYIVEVYVSGRK